MNIIIQDHNLIIDGDVVSALPRLDTSAKVVVWSVPTDYRPDGYFIAVHRPGEAEEIPACESGSYRRLAELDLDPHPEAVLAAAKARRKRQIEADRDAACIADVTALGRTWQADKRSQELLAHAITMALAGAPLPPVWRDADNSDLPISSISDLMAIAAAIAAQVQSAYMLSWQRKAAVDAAETVEEVEAA